MNYDFLTKHDRRSTGSSKWDQVINVQPPLAEDTISMSVADMDFPLAPEIREALQEYLSTAIPGYTATSAGYYEAVRTWFSRYWNWSVDDEWIIPTNGVVPDLYHAIQIMTHPRDGVIMFTPTYPPFYNAVREQKRRLVSVSLLEEDAVYSIDWEAFETAAQNPYNTVLILCNPHNPTGRVWTVEELERIGAICLKNGIAIISDDIHADLITQGHTHTPIASLSEELAEITVTLTAPSKTFNLAAFKISNMVISNPHLRRLFTDHRQLHKIGEPPITSLIACEAAYRHGRPWLDALMEVVEANAQTVREGFARFAPQVTISPNEGTYLLWVNLNSIEPDAEKQFELVARNARVLPNSGRGFGEEGAGWIRLNLATSPEFVREAMRRLENAITSYQVQL